MLVLRRAHGAEDNALCWLWHLLLSSSIQVIAAGMQRQRAGRQPEKSGQASSHSALRWTFYYDLCVFLVSAQISGWSQKCHTLLRECAQVYFTRFYLVTQNHLLDRVCGNWGLAGSTQRGPFEVIFKSVGIEPIICYNLPQTEFLECPLQL